MEGFTEDNKIFMCIIVSKGDDVCIWDLMLVLAANHSS